MRNDTRSLSWPSWTTGDRLRKAREHAGLTQDQLAERARISRRTIVNYEQDKFPPRYWPLRAWAEATGVDIEFLDPDETHRSRCTDDFPGQSALAA